MKRNFLILLLMLSAQLVSAATQIAVESYGAKGDGVTVNTQSIQSAIDECSAAGGGEVVLKSGVYLSGTVQLKDGVTLVVRRSAVLRGTTDPMDYYNIDEFVDATGQSRGECLVGAVGATNVGISGGGTIDGMGEHFMAGFNKKRMAEAGRSAADIDKYMKVRPFLLRFVDSDGVKLSDVNLINPAAWTCHLFQCRDINIDGISIVAHVNANNDGIDLDSCDGAVIKNCDINTGDDAMCIKSTSPEPCQNVLVSGCRLKSDWGAIKFGTESMGDYRNIIVEKCEVYDTTGGGIKVLSVDGANIKNVRVRNITMTNVDMPIFIRLGERLRTYRNAPQRPIGTISGLYISAIKATTRLPEESRVNPASGVVITGTPDARIGSVDLRNINITLMGGGTAKDAAREVPEDVKAYPEFSHFGVQPAFGINARHIDSLQIKSMSFRLQGEDARPVSKLEDVNHVPYEFPILVK